MDTALAHPVTDKERIFSIDVLRGFALLGILPMNIQSFSMVAAAYWNPTAYGDLHGANLWVWLLTHVLADSKFVTIFSMLFGAGILLMTDRAEAAGRRPAGLHYRRMGSLIVFGMLHGYLLWTGDILYAYGMCGLLVYLFRKCQPRTLILAGLLFMSIAPAITGANGWSSLQWSSSQFQANREQIWQPTPVMVERELATMRSVWITQMGARIGETLAVETLFFVAWIFWSTMGLMLIGMALFKLGVFSGERPARFYWSMIAVALFVGIPITIWGTYRDFAEGWDFRNSFFLGGQHNYWASVLVSGGWIGAMMLAARVTKLAPLTARLAAVGRMAFTNYIMHTVICTTIFYGHGLALVGRVERVGQLAIVLCVWAVQLIVSPSWLRHFHYGPLEWRWRSMTYMQRAPFRREA